MIPYYVIYALIFIADNFSKNSIHDEVKRKRFFCMFTFFLLFAMLALRHQTMGSDLINTRRHSGYIISFRQLNKYSWSELLSMKKYLNYERGFIIFNKLIGSICSEAQFFLGVCAFFSILPPMIYIFRKSINPLMSVCIYMGFPIILICFSGLRQAIAIGITILSLTYVEKKKPIPFILLTLLATQFHSSAIIFFIAYPLYHVKLAEFMKLLVVLFIPVVYILRMPIFTIASKIFKESATVTDTGAITLFLVFFMIYVFLIFFSKDKTTDKTGIINLFYIACVCQAFGGIYQLAMRVGYYFMIYAAIAIPNAIDEIEDKKLSSFVSLIIIIAFVAFGIYSFKTSSWAMTNPYIFFFEE